MFWVMDVIEEMRQIAEEANWCRRSTEWDNESEKRRLDEAFKYGGDKEVKKEREKIEQERQRRINELNDIDFEYHYPRLPLHFMLGPF